MSADETKTDDVDAEFEAMRTVYAALNGLDLAGQNRVLDYVFRRLGLKSDTVRTEAPGASFSPRELAREIREEGPHEQAEADDTADDELAGVSPVAIKWIRRNGLSAAQLSKVFSLGLDEIDLVASTVPGKSKREKMRHVLLLTGAAAYLSAGAARTDDDKAREALGHYNVYDMTNFSSYLKSMSADISGSKASGYTLTARGLAAAADLVKVMSPSASKS